MSITSVFVGNLSGEPELRYTPGGRAAATLRVAVQDRKQENGRWVDGETSFVRVNVWGVRAENVAESLTRGTRVIVVGRGKQRAFETKDGEKRTVFEVDADSIGPDLTFATAKVTKLTRASATDDDHPWDSDSSELEPATDPASAAAG
jgi:single-strand DNA-binding protein